MLRYSGLLIATLFYVCPIVSTSGIHFFGVELIRGCCTCYDIDSGHIQHTWFCDTFCDYELFRQFRTLKTWKENWILYDTTLNIDYNSTTGGTDTISTTTQCAAYQNIIDLQTTVLENVATRHHRVEGHLIECYRRLHKRNVTEIDYSWMCDVVQAYIAIHLCRRLLSYCQRK